MVNPGDAGNPMQNLLGDLLKAIGGTPGGVPPWWEAARTLAQSVATDGGADTNVDPLERISLEELARVAELHVAEATGLPVGSADRPPTFLPVSRATWADRALQAWRPALERMVTAQAAAAPTDLGALGDLGGAGMAGLAGLGGLGGAEDAGGEAGLAEILQRFAVTMGPLLLGLQFGSAAGHLARTALGQYALPLPWPGAQEILVVPANVAAFAGDWSLAPDETRLWVCVRELTAHAVLSRPHVAARIDELLAAAAIQMSSMQEGLAERLGTGSDPESLQQLMGDPESLLADLVTPADRYRSAQLTAITTAIGGYVDHVTGQVAATLTASAATLTEAWYRYRVQDSQGESASGALFGLELDRVQVDRGRAFVDGVMERAGEAGLARLWESGRTLPTPTELDAPGLWLERINLPDDPAETS